MGNNLGQMPLSVRLIQLCALVFILLGTVLIGSVVFLKSIELLSGIAITGSGTLFNILEQQEHAQKYLLIAQGLTAVISFILIPTGIIFFVWPDLKKTFRIPYPNLPACLLIAASIAIASIPLIAFLSEWNKAILQFPDSLKSIEEWMVSSEKDAEKLTGLLAYYHDSLGFWGGLLVIAVLPAIGEELLFRGLVQGRLMTILGNPHIAIITTGFLFSFIHFQFFGFIPRMFLGVLFGYMFYWSGNILVPMVMHFTNNALTFLALNFYKQKKLDIDLESTKDLPPATLLISIALCLFLLLMFQKNASRTHES